MDGNTGLIDPQGDSQLCNALFEASRGHESNRKSWLTNKHKVSNMKSRVSETKLLQQETETLRRIVSSEGAKGNAQDDSVVLGCSDQRLSAPELSLNDVLTDRVRAGQPIHVSGNLDDVQAMLHAASINRLMNETGLPVTVIHAPTCIGGG